MYNSDTEDFIERFFETPKKSKRYSPKQTKKVKKTKEITNNELQFPQPNIIYPKTPHQSETFECYEDYNLLLSGVAGSGKTFISMYLALEDIIINKNYSSLKIIRSTVPSRKEGFLPGKPDEKAAVYEAPYIDNVNELFHRSDAYSFLKRKNLISFMSTSYLRGLTFNDSIVIADEIQNMNDVELHTIITRIGDNCKLILIGDFAQNDLLYTKETSGILNVLKIIKRMPSFKLIEFDVNDIVRSGLVREYLIAKEECKNL